MSNLILRNFMTRKKEKELLIFTLFCLFLLFHFLLIASASTRMYVSRNAENKLRLMRTVVSFLCRQRQSFDTRREDKAFAGGFCLGGNVFYVSQRPHSCAFCSNNDNKLYCGSHVENCSHSREIFSIYIT